MNRNILALALTTPFWCMVPKPALAGPYGDDLGKCLVESSNPKDKEQFVQWMFFAIALNPIAKPFAKIPTEEREAADKSMARLFERLLGESCVTQAKKAMKYEGADAMGQSFKLLGEVAGQEIFSSPEVSAGVADFTKHIDAAHLGKALGLPEASE